MQPSCTTYLNVRGREFYEYLRFYEIRKCQACQGVNIGSIYLYVFGEKHAASFVVKSCLGADPEAINKIIIQSYSDGTTDLHIYVRV